MSIIKTIVTCMCVMLAMAGLSRAKEWRGIVPLHSTRADVERVLGSPTEPRGSIYKTENENVSIWYADEPCKKGGLELWNVPHDTVLSIAIYPKAESSVADLRLDEGKYRKEANPHRQGIVYYVNDDEGIRIETFERKVRSMTYTPAAKDNYLRCPNSSVQQSSEKEYHIRKFDEYSNISLNDEKARLDNLAIYLLNDEPAFKGYIIVYAGPRSRSGETQARAKRAKDYLVKVRGIEPSRIVTMDGGCRDRLEVELYALPSSVSPPTPNPYRNE